MPSPLHPLPLLLIAALLRTALLLYGLHQDAHSALKYTDIDYLVFTDAARSVSLNQSPYARETYRYTPLLSWLLLPTTAHPSFGKLLFSLADLLAGWLILRILRRPQNPNAVSSSRAGALAAIWLWNPLVATISTRGSSEGLLGVLTVALLWAVESRRISLAALLLGLSVHFKIYPFIYAPAIIWWMDNEHMGRTASRNHPSSFIRIVAFFSAARIKFTLISLATFLGLNALMYQVYGMPYITHSYLHHVTRIDHRHNFSPYNIHLYLSSVTPSSASLHAFLPQLLLSCVLIPLALSKKHLATCMLAQTFAFVTFNKVCTSQYFLWYLIFLPLHLPYSSLVSRPRLGITALLLWVLGQAAWLHQGYQLEFLGVSTFFPGMWLATLGFFLINCWILGLIIDDGLAIPTQVPKVRVE